jgi:hypothetical protein
LILAADLLQRSIDEIDVGRHISRRLASGSSARGW